MSKTPAQKEAHRIIERMKDAMKKSNATRFDRVTNNMVRAAATEAARMLCDKEPIEGRPFYHAVIAEIITFV